MQHAPVVSAVTEDFARLVQSLVKQEFGQRLDSGELLIGTTLRALCTEHFGRECSRAEQVQFIFFAAPIARRIAIDRADIHHWLGATEISVADLKAWLGWIDVMDPLTARMIDVYYIGGLSIKEVAAALGVSPGHVIRELRFAKKWLQIKLLEPESINVGPRQ